MIKPITNSAYKLLHDGSLALSQVEANGIRIDTKYLDKAIHQTSRQIKHLKEQIQHDEIFKKWHKHYGSKMKLGSYEQLGNILFNVLKYPYKSYTKTGRPTADQNALEVVDIPFVKNFLEIQKLMKAKNTYLMGIQREIVDGYLHPIFNLHLVRTYRGSCDSPNFQNIPIRNPEIGKLIRQCFIARDNYQLVEIDFSGIEVHGSCWYHKDPRMLDYINNPKKDMHRDMARQCFILSKDEMRPNSNEKAEIKRVSNIRYCGKSNFVFPQFYGDYYIDCSRSLWEAIDKMKLHRRDGYDLYSHLETRDIYELGDCNPEETPREGTFEKHIQEVEYDFWNNRFRIYNQWRRRWYEKYKQTGCFYSLSGFRYEGYFRRNEAINYPVQGVAFHCLLWSIIRIQKLLRKYNMRSLIVGQIHDSIISDVYRKEKENYLEISKQVMTVDIRKHWPWIITPIAIEAEVAPVGGNWFQKEKVKI